MTHTDEPRPDTETARDDAATLIEAFGGVRGMVDMTVPGLVFVVVYTITKSLTASCWAAFGLAGVFAVLRLLRRETVQHAFSGVFGVAIGAFIAMKSGKAENFYLPGMLYTLGLGLLYAVSAVVRWPLIGVLLGPVLGENLTWRTRNPGRARAYTRATWAWAAILLGKSAILFPLYWAGEVEWLGWLKVALGIPPFLLAVYLTWVFLRTAPPPIKVVDDADDADDAEEAGGSRTSGAGFAGGVAAAAAGAGAGAAETVADLGPEPGAASAGPSPHPLPRSSSRPSSAPE